MARAKSKAVYSVPLRRLIAWHKTAAVQELLLADPRKAREVMVIDRLVNLAPHEGVQQLAKQAEPGSAYAVIEAQARLFATRLGFAIDEARPFWLQFPPRPGSVLALYEAVRGLSDHELGQLEMLLAALTFGQVNCERLDSADSLFNRVARDLNADMGNHWRPDRAFLDRRTREQLAAIAVDCGYAVSAGSVRSYKKAELVNALLRHFASAHAASEPSPAQIKARQWLPEAMLFPAIDPDAPHGLDEHDAEHEPEDCPEEVCDHDGWEEAA